MRYKFNEIFQVDLSGILTTKKRININGVIVEPGTIIRDETLVGGIDLFKLRNYDLEGEDWDDDTIKLTAYFQA